MKKLFFKDVTFLIGIVLIVISLGIFIIPDILWFGKSGDNTFGIFILNYAISIIYLVVVWVRETRWKHFHENIEYGFLNLTLFLISAFSLNREIPVFQRSIDWLQVVLVLQGLVFIMFARKSVFPAWFQHLLFGFLGFIFMIFLYYSLYLIPIYPEAVVALFVLGFSLHALIPLLFVVNILFYIFRKDNRNKTALISFGAGVLFSLVFVLIFVLKWNDTSRIITRASDQSLLNEKNDLPEWIVIAQHLPKNAITEKILKTNLVYTTASENSGWEFMDMPHKNFDEVKKHDPLIMIATFLLGKPNLTDEHKIGILQAMYDSRHQAQERLWNGDDLQTSHVLTNARIFPGLRIAYTEKIISIRNNLPKQTWSRDQEAIYTFHLPEGGVVTSLSLWINGAEEKAVLTSKHQADSAYKRIVGVERHDPSLIRWQEGNTVSVRVFPCSPNEDRRFKIGITAPLRSENEKLVYDNIWFDGPGTSGTRESIKVKLMDPVKDFVAPAGFKVTSADEFLSEGDYQSAWKIQIKQPPIVNNTFCFDGKSYHISTYQKTFRPFDPQNIYLDINSSWTLNEFKEILKMTGSKKLYAFQNKLIQLDDQNAMAVFQQLKAFNFSIFPVYEIKHPESSLLISKGTSASPNVSDLGNSDFNLKLKEYLIHKPSLTLYNLGYELSPYLKTLKELRVFDYDYGSVSDLSKQFKDKKLVSNQEDNQNVIIHDAGIRITETPDSSQTNAPDHLLRLFAYNHIMFRTGVHYLDKDYFDKDIVDEAHKAYVVSPTTSMVVLETKNDYKRFGIVDDGTSLKNASMKSSGAVPEPHEWLLIILIIGVLAFITNKKYQIVK